MIAICMFCVFHVLKSITQLHKKKRISDQLNNIILFHAFITNIFFQLYKRLTMTCKTEYQAKEKIFKLFT